MFGVIGDWIGIVTGVIALASIICSLTPTPKDDAMLGKFYKCIELLDKKMNGSSYSDNDTQKCIYDLKMKLKVMNEQNEFLKNENTKLFYQNEYLRNAYYYCYNQNQYLYVENFQMKRCYSSLLENNSKLEEGNKRRRISDDESTTIK